MITLIGIKRTILALLAALFCLSAQATIIDLGKISFAGDFTLNHNYDDDNPSASPYGAFGPLTVQSATGIFAPFVSNGDTLTMSTPFMFGPTTPIDWTISHPMTWTIGGYTIDTQIVLITGPAFVGQNGFGGTDLSGNGFDPNAYPFYAFSGWNFIAPPFEYGFPVDITGLINMTFDVKYDDPTITPETGSTALLLALGLLGMGTLRFYLARP